MYYLNNGVHDQAISNMQAIDEYYGGEIIFYHTPMFFFFFFLWLENIVNQNYNKCSKLTLTQKLVEASKSQSKNASHA